MSATRTSDLLGTKATDVIHAIADPDTRDRVRRALIVCDGALEVVDALDLVPYEIVDAGVADLAVWEALAPSVRNVLMAVHGASSQLLALFPSKEPTGSIDIDVRLDLDEDGRPAPIRDRRDHDLDEIVKSGADTENIGRSIAALAGMLRHDFVQFGQRLRSPRVTADRWFLLSELQEMQTKCSQCLEAVAATIFSAFTDEPLDALVPRYASAARRAIQLRTLMVDLSYDVNRLNMALGSAGLETASAIRHALALRLRELAASTAYKDLRPQDKHTVIDYESRLAGYDDLASPGRLAALKKDVEGFSKFLEVLRSINQREVLVAHDRHRLQTIRMLLESEVDLEEVAEYLEDVYGRWPALDDFVRLVRRQRYPQPEDVLPVVIEAQESLRE